MADYSTLKNTYQAICDYKYNPIRNGDVCITERIKFNVLRLKVAKISQF